LGYTYNNDYCDAFQKHAELKRKAELRALNEHHRSQITDYFWSKEEMLKLSFIQPPVYYEYAPLSVNFTTVSAVVGRIIVNDFHFNELKYGNKSETECQIVKIYKEVINCLTKQHLKLIDSVGNREVERKKIITRNVAENSAVQYAFSAYKSFAEDQGELDFRLPPPMKHFTKDQLFFYFTN
ncbi:neprilysin-like protein, partial [Dinothrombium tinctorium]